MHHLHPRLLLVCRRAERARLTVENKRAANFCQTFRRNATADVTAIYARKLPLHPGILPDRNEAVLVALELRLGRNMLAAIVVTELPPLRPSPRLYAALIEMVHEYLSNYGFNPA